MLPSVFVPHGAPTFALQPGETGARLAGAAAGLPQRPRAVVVASAHWHTAVPLVGAEEYPETIHDFWGFPEPLYGLQYQAPGAPDLAARIVERLRGAGFPAQAARHGLDHAVWIPLMQMFPLADVPVVPLSIQPGEGPEHHHRIGQALAPLLEEGVLVVGSGNLTHSLRDFQQARVSGGGTPPYVREFADWVWRRLEGGGAGGAEGDEEGQQVVLGRVGAPGFRAGARPRARRIHTGVDDLVLAMDAYVFEPQPRSAQ